ncbi:unnamed protein product, partial [marine sediment metagenome]
FIRESSIFNCIELHHKKYKKRYKIYRNLGEKLGELFISFSNV